MPKPLTSIVLLLFIPFLIKAQVSIPNTLSDEEKLFGLSKFWQEVDYNFAFFDQVASDEEQRIRDLIAQFSKDLVAGNYDALVAAYTNDARIFPGNLEILKGSQAIRDYWTPAADRKSKTIYHKIIPEEIQIVEDTAYDWGYYEGKTQLANGEISAWKGKYVIVWQKNDGGDWKIFLDIWNRVQ